MMPQHTDEQPCKSCTVPTPNGDICDFCRDYVPPQPPDNSEQIASLAQMLSEFGGIVHRAAGRIPADAPIWASVDATAAAAHTRAASRLLGRAVKTMTGDTPDHRDGDQSADLLRTALADVDPASLTGADTRALLALLQAAFAAKTGGDK